MKTGLCYVLITSVKWRLVIHSSDQWEQVLKWGTKVIRTAGTVQRCLSVTVRLVGCSKVVWLLVLCEID